MATLGGLMVGFAFLALLVWGHVEVFTLIVKHRAWGWLVVLVITDGWIAFPLIMGVAWIIKKLGMVATPRGS